MAFIDRALVQDLNLDGSPNSLQRVELAIHQRFDSYEALAASVEDMDSLLGYLRPVFARYAACEPVPDHPALLRASGGQAVDLGALLREVFARGNGQVLFMACYRRLDCTAHLRD